MSIIIFEGVDNCGKTEISKAFTERNASYDYFKVKQERLIVEKTDPSIIAAAHQLQLNFFYELARQVDFNVVMDRFYPSEWVYGQLFRSVDILALKEWDKKFAELGTKIIICEKPDSYLEDEIWTKEQLVAVKQGYREFLRDSECDILLLNTESEDLDYELDCIDEFLNK